MIQLFWPEPGPVRVYASGFKSQTAPKGRLTITYTKLSGLSFVIKFRADPSFRTIRLAKRRQDHFQKVTLTMTKQMKSRKNYVVVNKTKGL